MHALLLMRFERNQKCNVCIMHIACTVIKHTVKVLTNFPYMYVCNTFVYTYVHNITPVL